MPKYRALVSLMYTQEVEVRADSEEEMHRLAYETAVEITKRKIWDGTHTIGFILKVGE